MASLATIPTELQCSIIRLLDPTSLISTSQTNQHFRKVIQPTRKHLIERLLQLECDETQGGIVPRFRATDNTLSPNWDEPEWTAMRWACSGCLRLLPGDCFDNHSLLRLAYRKPLPGSPAVNTITSWEPSPKNNPSLPHIRREKRGESVVQEKQTRRRYAHAVSNLWILGPCHRAGVQKFRETFDKLQNCAWKTIDEMDILEYGALEPAQRRNVFDSEREAIENNRCGYNRHLRKCHECRYQSGQLKPTLLGSDGVKKIPFTACRQYKVPNVIERHYPRFWEDLENKRPDTNLPSYYVHYKPLVRYRVRAMYMLRCPHCEKWKEARRFTVKDPAMSRAYWNKIGYPALLTTKQIDELSCHECYASRYGKEELGKELLEGLTILLVKELSSLTRRLGDGFRSLLSDPYSELSNFPKSVPAEIRTIVEEIAHRVAKTGDRPSDKPYLSLEEIVFLRERYDVWIDLRKRILQTSNARLIHDTETDSTRKESTRRWIWYRDFEDLEVFYRWLLAVYEEVERRPEKLVQWALDGSIGKLPPIVTSERDT